MTALVHIAAGPVRVGTVIRTRCAWCGALIDEIDVARIAVTGGPPDFMDDDGSPTARWQGLVAIDGGARWAVPDPEDGQVPPDSCMALEDGITA